MGIIEGSSKGEKDGLVDDTGEDFIDGRTEGVIDGTSEGTRVGLVDVT